MPTCRRSLETLVVVALLAVWPALAEAELRSGPQPGETLPGTFEPLNVTGEHAGERYCLVCAAGRAPTVMVFARTVNDQTAAFLQRLDAATAAHREQRLGSFAVFLSDATGLEAQLRELAERQRLTTTVLAIDEPAGPDGYELAAAADLTVVLYRAHTVAANHALRAGDLTATAVDRILADLAKILPAD
ncbi:MAG: hypothetical protein IT204_02290 [Fimbriimonadaceae bacterium]|nr:hypothetical protein [Fimbriimonadaceae bacterium]